MDGVMDGVVTMSNVMFRTTFFSDIWFFAWEAPAEPECTLCDKDNAVDFGLHWGVDGTTNTMHSHIGADGSIAPVVEQTEYIAFETWHNLVYAYEELNAKDTEVKYYLDGVLVK